MGRAGQARSRCSPAVQASFGDVDAQARRRRQGVSGEWSYDVLETGRRPGHRVKDGHAEPVNAEGADRDVRTSRRRWPSSTTRRRPRRRRRTGSRRDLPRPRTELERSGRPTGTSAARRTLSAMQTEIAFTLPRGLPTRRAGCIAKARCAWPRPATRSSRCGTPEVRQNEAYLSVLLLARTVTRIGDGHGDHAGAGRGPVRGRLRPPAAPLRAREHGRRGGRRRAAARTARTTFEVDLTDIEDGRLGE